ncbi:MAG: hypothetical protein ABGW87_03080 [Sphingomonadaceae bacterium]
MAESNQKKQQVGFTKSGKLWLIGCGLLFALSFPFGSLNNATQLTPDDADVISFGFELAGVIAILGAFILWKATVSWPLKNRIGFVVALSFITFLASILAFMPAAGIVEGWMNFPAASTKTFEAFLPIGRAYRSHSRSGDSWTIQPTPLWTNIDVTQADWDFMLTRRRPWDDGTDPDNISSNGYFCAKVTMQKSGDALRIIYSGHYNPLNWTYRLPTGAIVVCPRGAKGQPYLKLH